MANMKKVIILLATTGSLVVPLAAQQPGYEDPYLVGFANGEKAVHNDAAAYGVSACIATSLCIPLGCLPMGMAMTKDPPVTGGPRSPWSSVMGYRDGFDQGVMSGQEKVQSARTGAAVVGFIGGTLVFAALVPLVWMPMMFGD